MSSSLGEIIQEIQRLEDPNDKEKIFYRIKLSPKPSRDFIEEVYDCWNDPAKNPSLNQTELLTDYEGNLLIHASVQADAGHLIRLMREAILSVNQRDASDNA